MSDDAAFVLFWASFVALAYPGDWIGATVLTAVAASGLAFGITYSRRVPLRGAR